MAIADVSNWTDQNGEPLDRRAVAASASGRSGVVWNPATGEEQAKVDFASIEEVDHAVAVAKSAFAEWRATPLSRRAEVMFKLRELVDANRRRIAEMLTLEHGKTAARRHGRSGARPREHRVRLRHSQPAQRRLLRTGQPRHRRLSDPPAAGRGRRHHALQLSRPWCRCGCSPTPSPAAIRSSSSRRRKILRSACCWPSCCKQAGVPDGVFNVVQGDKVAVDRLLEHPDVKAISFVGSTPVARVHLRNRDAQRQARAGPGRREESHAGAARCRRSPWPPTPRFPPPTARRASAAWRSPWWSPWAVWPIR